MENKDLFTDISVSLKKEGFKKQRYNWTMPYDQYFAWVISFQKSPWSTQSAFTMTVNIGVYALGTGQLMFGRKDTINEPSSFFRVRPRFWGMADEWWDFDFTEKDKRNAECIHEMIMKRALPFLNNHRTVENLMPFIPLDAWITNLNFRAELIKLGIALLPTNADKGKEYLELIALENHVWAGVAAKVLKAI